MDLTVPDGVRRLILVVSALLALRVVVLYAHGQSSQNLIVHRQVLGRSVMRNLVVRAFYHLMLVQLPSALKAEGVTARE